MAKFILYFHFEEFNKLYFLNKFIIFEFEKNYYMTFSVKKCSHLLYYIFAILQKYVSEFFNLL